MKYQQGHMLKFRLDAVARVYRELVTQRESG